MFSVAAVTLTAGATLPDSQDSASSATPGQIEPALANTSAPPELRRVQVAAWLAYGGQALIYRAFVTDMGNLENSLRAPQIDPAKVNAVCTDVGQAMRSANAYFPIPDPSEQPIWCGAVRQMTQAGADCQRAAGKATVNCYTALNEMTKVNPVAVSLYQRLESKVR